MKKLGISNELALPLDAVTQTIVVYGMKGMGKSYLGGVFVEELYDAGLRFSVIDPMGVWWGLQHGNRRDQSGLEVLLLGGKHGDLPIDPLAGEVVADLVADETISVVIDISRHANGKAWSKGEKVRFVKTYMTRLYERQVEQRRPIMQIIDEAARYAPQKLGYGETDESHCQGAIAMVCEEGRNLGIGMTLLTQRSARLNKDVAELADVMIAFRTVGPNSVSAVTDWLGEHVQKERHKAIVEQLRKLPIGSALVISPGWLEFEGAVSIRGRRTFDSSATPKSGRALVAPGLARKPDLDKYRQRMTETIERAREQDPKEQRLRIKELERQVAVYREHKCVAEVDYDTVRKEFLAEERRLREGYGKTILDLKTRLDKVQGHAIGLRELSDYKLEQPPPIDLSKVNFTPTSHKAKGDSQGLLTPKNINVLDKSRVGEGNPDVNRGVRRNILIALAMNEGGLRRHWLAIHAGNQYNRHFRNELGWLRAQGYLEGENTELMRITQKGLNALGKYVPLPVGEGLISFWRGKFRGCALAIFNVLVDAYPEGLARDKLSERADYPYNRHFRNELGELRKYEVMRGKNTEVMRLTDALGTHKRL